VRGGRAGESPRGVDRCKSPESGSGGFGFDLCDVVRDGAVDRDATRLLRLGDFALQVDDEQAVLEAGALDLDVVGKGELALEVAGRDAVMQEGPPFLVALPAFEGQDVLLDRQFDLIRLESGERDRDLEVVLVEAFDVVGGIALLADALGGFGEVEQAVEIRWPTETGAKNLQCA